MNPLLQNVHASLPALDPAAVLVRGDYLYYHYGCDGVDDKGWGCGYRTLQTMCSWIQGQRGESMRDVPSIKKFQEALVAMEDKPKSFAGSKEWIGSFELCICIDYFYEVPCRLFHVTSGDKLVDHLPDLQKHFWEFGSVIMMGGDSDNASKGIVGVSIEKKSLLVVDPHYSGSLASVKDLYDSGMVSWRPLDSFLEHSFYNFCLPQLKAK